MLLLDILTSVTLLSNLALALVVPKHSQPKRDGNAQLPDYDYVVVGSGAGGGPVASRLAIAGFKVLLIDAGTDEGEADVHKVPALSFQSTEYEPTRWDFYVNHFPDLERQRKDSKMVWKTSSGGRYVGLNPPSGSEPVGILYPRAGTLGGSTAHNALIASYPHDKDWADIAALTGDSSWNPTAMRGYFQKLENNGYMPASLVGHGYTGWLGISLTSLTLVLKDSKLLNLILGASAGTGGGGLLGSILGTVAGLAQVLLQDANAPGANENEGLYQVPISMNKDNIRNGAREFILQTANAVNPDGSRKYQLDIQLKTLVTKVRFNTTGPVPRAVGVDFLTGQSLYRADPRSGSASPTGSGSVNALREVIISAGVYNTPQLLKLSGIGPQAELNNFDIPVIVNLPGVGTNLQDRYENSLISKTPNDFAITSECTWGYTPDDPCLQDFKNGIDPITRGTYATNGVAVSYIKKSSVYDQVPDVIIVGAPLSFTGYYPGYAVDASADAKHWTWLVLKGHTRNRAGTVNLRSIDPRDTPLINFNSYESGTTAGNADKKDLQASYEGFLTARNMMKSTVNLEGGWNETWPGAGVRTEQQIKEYIKNEAWGHHASCTCPIGADSDPMAVLDSKFRVRGTQGLRVVDASSFPRIPGFFITLPIYIMAEKAADVIIQAAQTV